eukprot:SAG31_NODE_1386_length_8574_cov_2.055037_12_plen_96_part_00
MPKLLTADEILGGRSKSTPSTCGTYTADNLGWQGIAQIPARQESVVARHLFEYPMLRSCLCVALSAVHSILSTMVCFKAVVNDGTRLQRMAAAAV